MRNALIVLTKVLPHYPKLTGFCSALDKRVEKIKQAEKDKRQDIYTLASVYWGQLRQKKSQMIDESKFHLKEIPKEKSKSSAAAPNANGGLTTSGAAQSPQNGESSMSIRVLNEKTKLNRKLS